MATLALRYGGSLRHEGLYIGIAVVTLVSSFLASKVEMFTDTGKALIELFTKQLKAPSSPISAVYSAASLLGLYWGCASLYGGGWGHIAGLHSGCSGAMLLAVAMTAFGMSEESGRSDKIAHGSLGVAAFLTFWHGHWGWRLALDSAHFYAPTLAAVLAALVAYSFVKK